MQRYASPCKRSPFEDAVLPQIGEQLLVRTGALPDVAAGAKHLKVAILIAAAMSLRHDVIDMHDAEREMRPASLAVPLLLAVESMGMGARRGQLPLIRPRGDVGAVDDVE